MIRFIIGVIVFCNTFSGGCDAAFAASETAVLEICVTGFENTNGVVWVSLHNSRKSFESDGDYFMGVKLKVAASQVIHSVMVPYGEYAIKVYHDENANNELDTRIFGIPAERYGFSNNVRGRFGAPAYEKARFIVSSPTCHTRIEIK